MKTVKTCRRFIGSFISIRGLSLIEARSFPVSLADIITSHEFRVFSDSLSAGDIDCKWNMTVFRNGSWSVNADFHDKGIIAGDFFFLDLLLDTDHSIGARVEGSILDPNDNRNLSLAKNGLDPFIRENWNKIEASGPAVTLHAAAALGELVLPAVTVLLIVGAVFFPAKKGRSDSVEIHPCGDPEDPGLCAEFHLGDG